MKGYKQSQYPKEILESLNPVLTRHIYPKIMLMEVFYIQRQILYITGENISFIFYESHLKVSPLDHNQKAEKKVILKTP